MTTGPDSVIVPIEEYERLVRDQEWLWCLEDADYNLDKAIELHEERKSKGEVV